MEGYLQGGGDGEGSWLDLGEQVQQVVGLELGCGVREVSQNLRHHHSSFSLTASELFFNTHCKCDLRPLGLVGAVTSSAVRLGRWQ